MKLILEHRRDVVKFPCVRDQPGRRVENGLQPSQDSVRGSIENAEPTSPSTARNLDVLID